MNTCEGSWEVLFSQFSHRSKSVQLLYCLRAKKGEKLSKMEGIGEQRTTYPHLYRMPVNGNWEQVSHATPSEGKDK